MLIRKKPKNDKIITNTAIPLTTSTFLYKMNTTVKIEGPFMLFLFVLIMYNFKCVTIVLD